MRKITTKAIALLITFSVATFAQQKGSFTDSRDKKTYKTVKIGNQTWMAENLNYSGSDGYLGLCYDKDPKNCQKYGRLYDWSEAMGIDRAFNSKSYVSKNAKQGVCPAGWHLPSDKEWQALVDFAGGKDIAGKKLKAKEGWKAYDFSEENPRTPKCKWTEEKEDDRGRKSKTEYDKCSTDEFGFSALPGGGGHPNGKFEFIGEEGFWWSSSESGIEQYMDNRGSIYVSGSAYYPHMMFDGENLAIGSHERGNLFSVRCVQGDVAAAEAKAVADADAKASSIVSGTFTDPRNKKEYKTVKIGNQTWMAENLNYSGSNGRLGLCHKNKPENCQKYGRLYDWSEAMLIDKAFNNKSYAGNKNKRKGVCPDGWHLPDDKEWDALIDFVGGKEIAGKYLKSKRGWNENGNGEDKFGFSALPGGAGSNGSFDPIGIYGSWWSSSEYDSNSAYFRAMGYVNEVVAYSKFDKGRLYSVRCVQD
jgi:uncharacterized protein (TIGR02145 family)